MVIEYGSIASLVSKRIEERKPTNKTKLRIIRSRTTEKKQTNFQVLTDRSTAGGLECEIEVGLKR
jgi:hypothetical protein